MSFCPWRLVDQAEVVVSLDALAIELDAPAQGSDGVIELAEQVQHRPEVDVGARRAKDRFESPRGSDERRWSTRGAGNTPSPARNERQAGRFATPCRHEVDLLGLLPVALGNSPAGLEDTASSTLSGTIGHCSSRAAAYLERHAYRVLVVRGRWALGGASYRNLVHELLKPPTVSHLLWKRENLCDTFGSAASIGLGIAGNRLRGRVELERPAQPVGDVPQVA